MCLFLKEHVLSFNNIYIYRREAASNSKIWTCICNFYMFAVIFMAYKIKRKVLMKKINIILKCQMLKH